MYEFDGASTLKRLNEAKNVGGQVSQLHFILADVNSMKGEMKEDIDPKDENLQKLIGEWVKDIEKDYESTDPELFAAIVADIHLRQTGRTKKYDIHVQDVIDKPMRGYKRNAIHSVQQIVDLDVFNKIRI